MFRWPSHLDGVENILGKEENAGKQHFLLSLQFFKKLLCQSHVRDSAEANFLSGVFLPLTSAKKVCEKSSQWLWKESSVSTGVSQETHIMHL